MTSSRFSSYTMPAATTFVASQWDALKFFGPDDVEVDEITKAFENKLNLSSLASPSASAAKRNIGSQKFIVRRNDYAFGTNDQKRQKTYDYTEQYCLNFVNLQPGARGKTVWDIISNLPSDKPHNATPSFFFQGIEEIFVSLASERARLQERVFPTWAYNFGPGLYKFTFFSNPVIVSLSPPTHSYKVFRSYWVRYASKMTSQDAALFEDTFTVVNINDEKYDRVSRLSLTSEDMLTAVTLDVNTELYPCSKGEKLTIMLATSLSLDGTKDDKGWRNIGQGSENRVSSLADMYDYVCHGKIYKFEDGEDETMFVPPCWFGEELY